MKMTNMSATEYDSFKHAAMAHYAADLIQAFDLSRAKAVTMAAASFANFLPDGQDTKENYFFIASDEDGEDVGTVWFAVRNSGSKPRLYVCDIHVEETHLESGIENQVLTWVEQRAREMDLDSVAIHVYGHHPQVHDLFSRAGFNEASVHMIKQLN